MYVRDLSKWSDRGPSKIADEADEQVWWAGKRTAAVMVTVGGVMVGRVRAGEVTARSTVAAVLALRAVPAPVSVSSALRVAPATAERRA
jgi:hypothetical protein